MRTNNSRCMRCVRMNQKLMGQQMAALPADRVRPARPFNHVGVDYAGPILVRRTKANTRTVEKRYVAVFVCMATKAVHLELAEDLSADAFLDVFIRFTSIRGPCARVWSDNGTNFVGAAKELQTMLQSWRHTTLFERIAEKGTEWRFITPAAPHQGGLWEAAVKSMKHHLRRVIGAQTLTAEGLNTVLAQVAAVLNSRPLAPLSDDTDNLEALTPAHFLIGEPMIQPCGANVQAKPTNRLRYFAQRQAMAQHFWKRWSEEYLHQLQHRPKWQQAAKNIGVGELVLVRQENIAPTVWPLARVVAVHPGKDGCVRNVTIRTTNGELCRPIQKLVHLPTTKGIEENFEGAGCSTVHRQPDREPIGAANVTARKKRQREGEVTKGERRKTERRRRHRSSQSSDNHRSDRKRKRKV